MTPITKALARYLHGETKRHWAPFDLPYQSKYAKAFVFSLPTQCECVCHCCFFHSE